MRIAILSDIHANTPALNAVLLDSRERQVERYWFLGDAIGYGPDPVTPLCWLKDNVDPHDWVPGNHEDVLIMIARATGDSQYADLPEAMRQEDWLAVNTDARRAAELNLKALQNGNDLTAHDFWHSAFTRGVARSQRFELDGLIYGLIHDSHKSPYRYIHPWEELYISEELQELREITQDTGQGVVQCYGHTHVPTLVQALVYEDQIALQSIPVQPGQSYSLRGEYLLVNPGSVGQPRDLSHCAAYAVLDTDAQEVTFYRVPYDWRPVYQTLYRLGYPESCSRRLRDPYLHRSVSNGWHEHFEKVKKCSS